MRIQIRINHLPLQAIIGTNEKERQAPQKIVLNVRLEYDAEAAIQGDDLHKAVDYFSLKERIEAYVAGSRFFLLEKLAASLLTLLMSDDRILAGRINIDKPDAIRPADSVSVSCQAGVFLL